MPLLRVKARWTGFSGAPGYTVLHFGAFAGEGDAEAAAAATATRNFFNGFAADLAGPVRIQVEPEVEIIDDATGQLLSYADGGTQSVVAGLQTTPFSAVSGACISWGTDTVRNGRRIRGRTFIVPLTQEAYEGDGTLTASTITRLNDASNQLRDSGTAFQIYARPTAKGASDGVSALATSQRVSDKAAVLRSRRD